MSRNEPILKLENVKTSFVTEKNLIGKPTKIVRAVNGVSFTLNKGDMLGIVGESGCGKSTLARTVLRLVEPESGKIIYNGTDILSLNKEQMRKQREKMQMVFQDPYASLNPRMTVREIIESSLRVYNIGNVAEREEKIKKIMELTELREEYLNRYPYEFSGGQRQRIVIARALVLHPEFIVFDEPVSALDVSVRAQVLNLLADLKKELAFTSLFISHDLSVIKYICNKTAVMYLGHIVELADKDELYANPRHPYTQALFSAIPIPKVGARKEHQVLEGEIPSPLNPPSGCPFHTRCPKATALCRKEAPVLENLGEGHSCACHYVQGNSSQSYLI